MHKNVSKNAAISWDNIRSIVKFQVGDFDELITSQILQEPSVHCIIILIFRYIPNNCNGPNGCYWSEKFSNIEGNKNLAKVYNTSIKIKMGNGDLIKKFRNVVELFVN